MDKFLLARELFRWYLRKFPLRDGKARLYGRLKDLLRPHANLITITLDRGFSLSLDLDDPEQNRLYFYGDYDERREADLISRVLDPGEVFWDVGANIGFFTLLAAACLKGKGLVVALEPAPAAWEQLQRNLRLNPWTNIVTLPVAASDREGTATLYFTPRGADGGANLYAALPKQSGSTSVPTLPLDTLRAREGLPYPHFLKVDVEGAEYAALQGARDILAAGRPLLLVELKEERMQAGGWAAHQLEEYLRDFGYRPAGLERRRWRALPTADAAKGRNLLWWQPDNPLHQEKLARIPLRGV